ncbi:MAG TPA: tRNA pseudouridine(38-40) synthase TruA [Alphaproteobacteria bacterium]|nr:tRNA pseudouridine(38-40) synthase TruA [Rickettsiales bacterium]HAE75135.1 tRNA pseudouridine(38-40) synthase TruA [Alphaproteobacteria bacterium]|tara:strand:- start:6324 stop:7067 length:744 start_codon:yes stop_codon:yes gene_type:complete
MPRIKLEIEYDGTGFVGWQKQENGVSVQNLIENALLKAIGQRVNLYVAGRTDAGVHAIRQVAHFDYKATKKLEIKNFSEAINFYIKNYPISILNTEQVTQKFHARFSAKSRVYLYRISNRRSKVALDRNRVWLLRKPLNIISMKKAAKFLIGKHDFNSFRSVHCQARSSIKSLKNIEIKRKQEELRITLTAPSFLHNQVRIIVGTLKMVGEGKIKPKDMLAILKGCERKLAGPTAPANGLYFVEAKY